jgi:hypothetical protein
LPHESAYGSAAVGFRILGPLEISGRRRRDQGGRAEATGIARASTVFNYARRGRGKSGDTRPYAVQREIEDIEALVAEAGGSGRAHVRF